MANTTLCLSFFLAILFLTTTVHADDAAAMLKFAASLTPPPYNWSTNTTTSHFYCSWSGIRCDSSKRVTSIILDNSNLSGTIPPELSTLSNLQVLSVCYNSFSGPIPSLANLSSLQVLNLSSNYFTSIPHDFFLGFTSLKEFQIGGNSLDPWSLPTDLADCTNLTLFAAWQANAVGTIPDIFASLHQLRYLSLRRNSFTGSLPASFAKSRIQMLYLNHQSLSGSIGVLSSMTKLRQVWMDANQFTGAIPDLSNCTDLFELTLSDNILTGVIPPSLAYLTQLQHLDVSYNNLRGKVPAFAPSMKLITTPGNPLLVMDGNSGMGNGGHKGLTFLIAGIVASLIFLAILVVLVKYCYFTKALENFALFNFLKNRMNCCTDRHKVLNQLQDRLIGLSNLGNVVISYEVLQQATDNFNEDNILGKGGSGVVYKGQYNDGTKIAVKMMEALTGFEAEISVLTRVRHRHLVAFLGFCMHENKNFLIYEYMPQGTLEQHLFEWREHEFSPLTWKQRVTIAIDVARAVEYLHSLAQQSFIHRDLKPLNILLGNDLRAKVADFDLVKFAPDEKQSLETKVAGTFGYLAPEYPATGKVTRQVDVYAFGVILMGLTTGRKAIEKTLIDEGWMAMHLVTWFLQMLKNGDIRSAIDQTLILDDEILSSICKVAELAGHCVALDPQQRPDMGHIVSVLRPLVEHWMPADQEEDDPSLQISDWPNNMNFLAMRDDESYSKAQSSSLLGLARLFTSS